MAPRAPYGPTGGMGSESNIDRVNVLGVGISVLNLESCVAAMRDALSRRAKGYICITGVHGVMESQDDPSVKAIHNRAFLVTPDGMPMVWMGRLAGRSQMSRVYGPDLLLRMCAVPGVRHFFYGGSDGVAQRLKERLESRFPGLVICGVFEPPWRALSGPEEDALAAQVRQAAPDIIWVGLSTPKQERFMAEYLPKLDTTLMVGVGAAFDFHSGRQKQAPRWMMNCGLEWLYRIYREPRRLWRRYLRNNPRFILLALAQKAGLRKFPLGV